ncbi:hypothetical protein K3495_g477 [Podosphaera aphanis]|nr:hypothetical protein K3495_g477 [Podosphaera aphanis]
MGFHLLKADSNVFRHADTIISTYVDDFMIISASRSNIDKAIKALANPFQLKDLGNMTKFLGINIEKDSDGIRINQRDKIDALCQDIGMVHCRGASTPISDDNLLDRDTDDLCSTSDAVTYRYAVGTPLQIANMTRPDRQYAVNRLCRCVRSPSKNAFLSLKHLVRYVSRTKSAALFSQGLKAELTASSDSSWGSTTSSRGTSGNIFFICGTPIAWTSKNKTVTAQSTCEAEYAALTTLTVTAQWLRPLYEELFQVASQPVRTEIDNTAAMITSITRHDLLVCQPPGKWLGKSC